MCHTFFMRCSFDFSSSGKFRGFLSLVLLIWIAGHSAAHAEITLDIDAPHSLQGTSVVAVIRINTDKPLAGFNAEITFPAGVTPDSASLGGLLSASGNFTLGQKQNGQVLRVVAYSGQSSFTGSGVALKVFLTLENNLEGLQQITFATVNPEPLINSRHAVGNNNGSESLAHSVVDKSFLVFSPTSDFDNDDLPDAWEVKYGLDPLVDNTGSDSDGDGYTDKEEFEAGTNPKDKNDKPVCFGGEFIFCDSFEVESET